MFLTTLRELLCNSVGLYVVNTRNNEQSTVFLTALFRAVIFYIFNTFKQMRIKSNFHFNFKVVCDIIILQKSKKPNQSGIASRFRKSRRVSLFIYALRRIAYLFTIHGV